jgi:hypothetical protein
MWMQRTTGKLAVDEHYIIPRSLLSETFQSDEKEWSIGEIYSKTAPSIASISSTMKSVA